MIILRQHRGVRLANERYEEIKADIIDMFEECDVHTFPLNAFDIAETLHYNVVPYSSLPVEKRIECHCISKDGCSELDYNQETGMYTYNIYYNDSSDIDDSRVHFTIMHEIGHKSWLLIPCNCQAYQCPHPGGQLLCGIQPCATTDD